MSEAIQTGRARRPDSWIWLLKHLKTPWTIVILAPLLVLVLDQAQFAGVIGIAVSAFLGTLPYIAVAVFLIAYLKASGAEAYVGKAFEGRETQAIFLAALFGGLAPFCSCEVIPFIAGLLAVGAPLSAIMAFWLSSPLIDPPTLVITAASLGWPFAIGKAAFAVALGLFGGFTIKLLLAGGRFQDPVKQITKSGCGCGPDPFKGKPVWTIWSEERRTKTFRTELIANSFFLVKWLALAYVLEALLITYVPADMITSVVGGDGIMPVVIAALVGMPAYLNGYAAPPLLAGLMDQGMSAGAAMAFMMAGAVSCIPAMAAVWSLVKIQVFTAYIALGLAGAVIAGLIFQTIV